MGAKHDKFQTILCKPVRKKVFGVVDKKFINILLVAFFWHSNPGFKKSGSLSL